MTKQKISCLVREVSSILFLYLVIRFPCVYLVVPPSADGTVRLRREVVLLTDDRNLCVKALTRNVPVRDIPAFLSWAKVG